MLDASTIKAQVEKLFCNMYDALDKQKLDRDKLRDITDEMASFCMAQIDPAISPLRESLLIAGMSPASSRFFELLSRHLGKTVSREAILGTVWSHRHGGPDEPDHKLIEVYVCKIRKTLREQKLPFWIETVWGVGYKLIEITEESQRINHPGGSRNQKRSPHGQG